MKRIITKMYLCLLAFCITGGISAQTQNSMTEVIPFKTIDGKIIVEATIMVKQLTLSLIYRDITLYFLKLSKSYTSIQKREELLVLTKILYLNRYLLERYMKWEQ